MQVDPRLERLQALIEQKQLSIQQSGRVGSIRNRAQPSEASNELQKGSFIPPGNNSTVPARRGSSIPDAVKTENPLSKSFQEFNIGSRNTRVSSAPGKEHLGQNLDLYA